MLIYGINAVTEALRAGRVREIRVAARSDSRLRALLDEARAKGVPVRAVAREVLDAESQGSHQGVVGDVLPAPPATLQELARVEPGGHPPLIVVLGAAGWRRRQSIGGRRSLRGRGRRREYRARAR